MEHNNVVPIYRIRSQERFSKITIECLENQSCVTLPASELIYREELINGLSQQDAMIVGYIAASANAPIEHTQSE